MGGVLGYREQMGGFSETGLTEVLDVCLKRITHPLRGAHQDLLNLYLSYIWTPQT